MKFFPENYVVTINVPLKNGEGQTTAPSAVSAVVVDVENEEIVNLGSLALGMSTESMDVEIPGTANVLASGEIRRAQILVVTMTFPEGDVVSRHTYGVERDITLEIMTNSFMTYAAAEVMAYELVSATGWLVATESQRKVALINAFNKLTEISMKWHPRDEDGCVLRHIQNEILFDTWEEIDKNAFDLFPSHFKRALRRAQFAEANELLTLGNDVAASKARQGIIREKIGQSEVEYDSSVASVNSQRPISSGTISALAGYIHPSMNMGSLSNMKVNRA